jgi:Terpene cyclase DEP1
MKNLYLVLAIVGAIVPYVFFVEHFSAAGFGLGSFLASAFANGAAGGATADLIISSLVFWIYLIGRRTPNLWLYMVVNVTIGLSCALPLYLYLTSRAAVQTGRPAIA